MSQVQVVQSKQCVHFKVRVFILIVRIDRFLDYWTNDLRFQAAIQEPEPADQVCNQVPEPAGQARNVEQEPASQVRNVVQEQAGQVQPQVQEPPSQQRDQHQGKRLKIKLLLVCVCVSACLPVCLFLWFIFKKSFIFILFYFLLCSLITSVCFHKQL